jgi:hypothetical protein
MKRLLCLSVSLAVCVVAAALALGGTSPEQGSDTAPVPRASAQKPPRPKLREGFEMRRVGSHYEPVVHWDPLVFRLPGTQMTFASYNYLTPHDEMAEPRYGFFLDNGRFYYVRESAASEGDAQYALFNGYFIVDGFAWGASHNRSMYLFKYDKDSVKLLDMIGEADSFLDFMSDYPGEPAYGHPLTVGMKDTPVWIIKDQDGHGNPLIRLKIMPDRTDPALFDYIFNLALQRVQGNRDPEVMEPLLALEQAKYESFYLYVKIVTPPRGDPRMQVALDPELYEPLFDRVRETSEHEMRPTEYYIYGVLAGKVGLPQVKTELAGNEARQWIVDILGKVDTWDAKFHDRGEQTPKILEYKLKGR